MFGDKYRKIQLIGKGAFGEAWKVESRRRGGGIYIMKERIARGTYTLNWVDFTRQNQLY